MSSSVKNGTIWVGLSIPQGDTGGGLYHKNLKGIGLIDIGLIIPVHGCGQTFGKEIVDGFAYSGYDRGDDLLLVEGEVTEHIGDNIGFAWFGYSWAPDANPKTRKSLTAQAGDDRFYPLVPAGATTLADAYLTHGEVKVVLNDQEVIETNVKSLYQAAYCLSTQVHKGLGSGQHYLSASYLTDASSGFPLLSIKWYALRPGKVIKAHKPHIVAVVGITPPRITQADN